MKIILNLIVVMIIVLIINACGDKTPPKIVKEPKTPDIIVIGTQTWTAKNLDVATFRNGDVIPEAKTNEEWKAAGKNKQAAWCYYENNPENGTKYGKLYNWYAVKDTRGLAPAGWHVPTDQEWTVLYPYLGGEGVVGKKMKSRSGWLENGNGTNSTGFAGLPGGCRVNNGDFGSIGYVGCWWSTLESGVSLAWGRKLYSYYSDLYSFSSYSTNGFSVRCVKD